MGGSRDMEVDALQYLRLQSQFSHALRGEIAQEAVVGAQKSRKAIPESTNSSTDL